MSAHLSVDKVLCHPVHVRTSVCGQGVLPSCVLGCDFESPCPLSQRPSNTLKWTLHSGQTGSTGTGPNNDHTIGNSTGHYVFIEASRQRQSDTAILYSPSIVEEPGCSFLLSFYYSMYGADIGTLSVKMTGSQNDIWSLTGEQSNQWLKATIPLSVPKTNSTFQEGGFGVGCTISRILYGQSNYGFIRRAAGRNASLAELEIPSLKLKHESGLQWVCKQWKVRFLFEKNVYGAFLSRSSSASTTSVESMHAWKDAQGNEWLKASAGRKSHDD
ncbi:MAM and LDL-receptor class a domain-containing protein 1 [Plakobranchus ocellatus]|uniref:MAM and LDL-receptor class a domain-containing protein 1 n=1 Tax=Plakobranchus ocellatus TaxID=259542 RepID=A0AAV4E358_9GAST|nr:MAM and LDL-receptor class a domain-containing protein 1 [Plakobranchus ocellatus]